MSVPHNTPPRILCVDNRVASLEVRRTLLSRLGYDVLIASEPSCALAILQKASVDLIILDYSFPGQMNGEQLARAIRGINPGVPLIMLSGYPDLPSTARESVDTLVLKGAGGPSELLNAVANLLGRSGTQERPPVGEQSRNLMQRSEQVVQRSKELQQRREKAS